MVTTNPKVQLQQNLIPLFEVGYTSNSRVFHINKSQTE